MPIRKTIKGLEDDLRQAEKQYEILNEKVTSFRNKMGELFEYEKTYGHYSPMPLAIIEAHVEELLKSSKTVAHLRQEGEQIFSFATEKLIRSLEGEKGRLWYMMRVALNDKTLVPLDYSEVDDGNGKPFVDNSSDGAMRRYRKSPESDHGF